MSVSLVKVLYMSHSPSEGFRDVQPVEELRNPRNGWRSEYDEETDSFFVTGPEGTSRTYSRVR